MCSHKVRWFIVVCGLLLSCPVHAAELTSRERAQIGTRAHMLEREALEKAMERCETTRVVISVPVYDFLQKVEVTGTTTLALEWSGSCAAGKRDGEGTFTWTTETITPGRNSYPVSTSRGQGRFVNGRRLGLWCGTKTFKMVVTTGIARPERTLSEGCAVFGGNLRQLTPHFQKQADGSWLQMNGAKVTDTRLAAGELEAQATKVLASAGQGAPVEKVEVAAQSHALDDLLPGARIILAPAGERISWKDKRVALLLSSRTLEELERFKRERQALIDATAGSAASLDLYRQKFIAASDPEKMLGSLATIIGQHVKLVKGEDDLVALKQGHYDYAFVFDWKSLTRFDLLGRYGAFPEASTETLRARPESAPACDLVGGFLITPDLKAIRSIPQIPICTAKVAVHGNSEDQSYMRLLAMHFERTREGIHGPNIRGNTMFSMLAVNFKF